MTRGEGGGSENTRKDPLSQTRCPYEWALNPLGCKSSNLSYSDFSVII